MDWQRRFIDDTFHGDLFGHFSRSDMDSFIVHVKTYDIYKDIAEDAETRFDPSNFEIDRPLPKGKNKKG